MAAAEIYAEKFDWRAFPSNHKRLPAKRHETPLREREGPGISVDIFKTRSHFHPEARDNSCVGIAREED